MAGTDTARGISFQHAQAVSSCLDVLERAEVAYLRVEGTEDIVDLEICAADDGRLQVTQVKTRQEPYTWGPAEIVEVIQRWSELERAERAGFDFVTDGSLGSEAVNSLLPALGRARRGELTEQDSVYLQTKGLNPEEPILARVTISSRQPHADSLLDTVAFRLLRLLEMAGADRGTERAETLINQLFRVVSVRAGEAEADARLINRDELAATVGVPLEVIDQAGEWTPEARELYERALTADPPHPSLVLLGAHQVTLRPESLALVIREQPQPGGVEQLVPASRALDESAGAVLSGSAGAGKTSTLQLLTVLAVERGLLPVLASVEGYFAQSLHRLVRESLERRVERRLMPGAVREVLATEGTVLLLDGAGELAPEARTAFIAELQGLQREYPALKIIATSRDPARLRALRLPSLLLRGLDHRLRRTVARELLGQDDEEIVRGVERRLGDLVSNPLLFVMALSLASQGLEPESRVELFDGFMEGLTAREGGEALSDRVVAALRDACFSLRAADQYGADRWTWLGVLAEALARLADQRVFAPDNASAEDVLESAVSGGLVRSLTPSNQLALAHDLFCDFLAAEAVRLDQRELPATIDERFEEIAVFLSEREALTSSRARAVLSSPVAAARSAAASSGRSRAPVEPNEASELFAPLLEHLGADSRARLGAAEVSVLSITDHDYFFLAPRGRLGGERVDLEQASEAALRTVRLRSSPTALKAAVALWLAELRAVLWDQSHGELVAIPDEREALPAMLEEAFKHRRDALRSSCKAICPGLSGRIERQIGMSGFRAVVLPVEEHLMPFGGGTPLRMHPMTYTFNAPDIHVRLADEVTEQFLASPAQRTSAEDWLSAPPADAALSDIRKALADLLPGFASP